MAQKIAPAALRLYTNKKFDASWFSDRMYGSLLQQTLNIKKFVHSIFESIGTKTALSHVQATPQHIYIPTASPADMALHTTPLSRRNIMPRGAHRRNAELTACGHHTPPAKRRRASPAQHT